VRSDLVALQSGLACKLRLVGNLPTRRAQLLLGSSKNVSRSRTTVTSIPSDPQFFARQPILAKRQTRSILRGK